ncbi:type VI secretion system baseplate subunit TssF, partial [bacterium]|nr:type VI secretion system baseplate subunit TssF [bacterium]
RRIEATEVFCIDRVAATSFQGTEKLAEYRPFYSLRHHLDEEDDVTEGAFWHMQRRPSGRKDDSGTDVFLSFSDLLYRHVELQAETLTVQITCTNRDLPARLPFGDRNGDFDMEVAAPVERIRCLLKPTPARRSALGGALQWRLISHLSLNHLSLVEGGEEALREILKLYDFDNSPATRQQIHGIVKLESRHVTRRVERSFCRGIETTITFDEDKFAGAGVYLFSSVLERFLGQYVSVNSFSRLIAGTLQRKERLAQWPPRNGNRILL